MVDVFFEHVDYYKIINVDIDYNYWLPASRRRVTWSKICTCGLEMSMVRPGLEPTIFRFRDRLDADMASSYAYHFSDVCLVFVLNTTMITMFLVLLCNFILRNKVVIKSCNDETMNRRRT